MFFCVAAVVVVVVVDVFVVVDFAVVIANLHANNLLGYYIISDFREYIASSASIPQSKYDFGVVVVAVVVVVVVQANAHLGYCIISGFQIIHLLLMHLFIKINMFSVWL